MIIPCGKEKVPQAKVVAAALYRGEYFNACLDYVLRFVNTYSNVRILSAKYGLLSLDQEVCPYNIKMGEKNCISWIEVVRQAILQDILDVPEVISLAGGVYKDVCRKVWPKCVFPMEGVGAIGKQLAWLKSNT